MKLNEIKDVPGSSKTRKRVGRGIGSGKGKTAGRGVKGQKARSGVAVRAFEGGQMPIYRRLPKRGFNNPFATDLNELNVGRLQGYIDTGKVDASAEINVETLVKSGVFSRVRDGFKLLGHGELKAKVTVVAALASAKALEAVEKAGGKVTVLNQVSAEA
jgi:large subunit ribosomal protein L15